MPDSVTASEPTADPPIEIGADADAYRFRVGGMSCAGCAASVQQAIEAETGVVAASVSVTDGMATVRGQNLQTEGLIQAIQKRGFEAELLVDAPDPGDIRSEIELRQARTERAWRHRAIIGLGVWIPLLVLHWTVHAPWVPWVQALGATFVLATAGSGFYASAWRAAMHRTSNMDTLISIGATTAWAYSLVVWLWGLDYPLYFGESAALLGIISLGHWIESRATAAAGSAVRDLLELQPEVANRLDETNRIEMIPTADVARGDRLRVRPFERIPVDGTVVDGGSEIDESVVTGESMPVYRTCGDTVIAGTTNTEGTIVLQATTDGRHTTLSRIADLVQQAQSSRTEIQRLADRICAIFVPTVLSIAAITVVGWFIAGNLTTGLIAAVTVLIISCPCALGLATPMAIMVGAGSASRRGILFRSAAAMEQAGAAQRVIFDKTGTLTTGQPAVVAIDVANDTIDPDDLLRSAASVEAISEHPIARAVVGLAAARGLDLRPASAFRARPGEGVTGTVDGHEIDIRRHASATCEVLKDGKPLGTITVADQPRPDAADAIQELRTAGLDIRMISGDRPGPARDIGGMIGINENEIHAEATPESKLAFIEELGAGTIMVGDGVNDAAALARADLGIAMSSGTNIAIESADVIIPGDRVAAVAETVDISRRTLVCIRQNLAFAFLYNGIAIPAAAFGLLAEHGPLIAAAAMALSDLTVIGNAMRLRWILRRGDTLVPDDTRPRH